MRVFIWWVFSFITGVVTVSAQQQHPSAQGNGEPDRCVSALYVEKQLAANPSLRQFFQSKVSASASAITGRGGLPLISIPVVVHILYHDASQNIPDAVVNEQLRILNECFQRLNADTVNTPERFRPVAADAGFEFRLATSDPMRRSTTGIIRKYTPVIKWTSDDQVKHSEATGDDAWDASQYLNIWVCSLGYLGGYSSLPGGDPALDGVVLNFSAFGNNAGVYGGGKTAVHEAGHWLGLRHIWGDEFCGDDLVDDTPKQAAFTTNCSTGIQPSCDNGPDGNMYMNYMDLTADGCTNLFTNGQTTRMRSLFVPGGARYAILSSRGLQLPLITEIPVPEEGPSWLYTNLYPNPASSEITIDFSNDIRWVGSQLRIANAQGQQVSQLTINNKIMRVGVSQYRAGYYFITARKENGETMKMKFIKL